MEAAHKKCQSCGMPMTKDPEGGGTNADGTKSRTYCSHCWVSGAFTQPDLTAAGMQDLVKGKMREMGFPAPLGWLFTRSIPKLERWRRHASV